MKIHAYNQPKCILPISFFEGRFIPDFHPDSLDYEQWWDEQINRCLNGWSDGGYTVTGKYYYHLNFKKINLINARTAVTEENFPLYSEEDQELFNNVDEAKKLGKGIMLITGRGFGKSFDAASIAEHEYTFYPQTEVIISASTSDFADKLWEKVLMGLNSQPDDIRHNFLSLDGEFMESGDKIKANGKDKVIGYRCKMRKVVYGKDAGKTRGSRPAIHIFEEIGSWTAAAKLKQCYKLTEPSWWRGSRYACLPFLIGTGGEMETGGSEDAKEMAFNPDAYNLLAFHYKEQKICKFYPAYKKFEGFYEQTGVSDEKGAMEFLKQRRKNKESDPELAKQESMEFPFELEEAFQTKGDNLFPVNILENRFVEIMRSPDLQSVVERGNLIPLKMNKKIVGVEWERNDKGIFEIAEHPVWTRKGWTSGKPSNLYVGGIDSFDSVMEKTKTKSDGKPRKSSGSHFMLKRFWPGHADESSRLFVAKFTQRTDDSTEFYWNTILLSLYYGGAKSLIEYTQKGIFFHYISNGFEHLLYPKPRLDTTVIKESVTTNRYGIAMPIEVKLDAVKNLARYVREYNGENLYFISLIKQMIDFRWGSSVFDELMAAAIALMADQDMVKIGVREEKKVADSWPVYRQDRNGKLVFD